MTRNRLINRPPRLPPREDLNETAEELYLVPHVHAETQAKKKEEEEEELGWEADMPNTVDTVDIATTEAVEEAIGHRMRPIIASY